MKTRVEFCFSCDEITTQKADKNNNWYCENCNSFISSSSSTTVLGNFINERLKKELMEKVNAKQSN